MVGVEFIHEIVKISNNFDLKSSNINSCIFYYSEGDYCILLMFIFYYSEGDHYF